VVVAESQPSRINVSAEGDSPYSADIPEFGGFSSILSKESASETYCAWEALDSPSGTTRTFRIACLNRVSTTMATCHEYFS
jgi:hypothetical protein